ncbi:hypothetical protein SISNIDRAFT_424279 [Sistotremastrum niveocremeum HHB9708]|uniref:PQ-loop-domain-containing protein n=2 Tax=Sistotremastraceae TaxID=3402574 RepID=A0A164Y8T4_9AGAM|nr:hypothetical protein SISNIDRAFT_424279 [Sistotremastrum niveocremeum HHB9708]KZT42384.1 hypothetical protein SISSUDRAFT_999433 [Sistotremastrum suecicum HHB10207 ss-3]
MMANTTSTFVNGLARISEEPQCRPQHDIFATVLSVGLILGLLASYIPQHYRIIHKGSSEGFSPWFLLLGSTSSAAGMLNLYTLQWGIIKCCRVLSAWNCIESLGAIIQVTIQWSMFSFVFILYLIYYPTYLKFEKVPSPPSLMPHQTNVKTNEWRMSIVLAWATLAHFVFSAATTLFLLLSTAPQPATPEHPSPDPTRQISLWATFLGVTSAALAVIQYAPQLVHTYRAKLVGAISIPMMCIQSPGAAVMVVSIALREGTNWTSWAMYAASGIMQGSLLIMCLFWKARQRRLGIDDFGVPVSHLEQAVAEAESDSILSPDRRIEEAEQLEASEETPLLAGGAEDNEPKKKTGWFGSLWKR